MAKFKKFRTLEEGIVVLQKEIKSTPLSVGKILRILSGKGRPVVLMLLSLPFCQPIQIPGLSIFFGLLIALIGLRIGFGRGVWLPKPLLLKNIAPHTLKKITDRVLKLVRKIKPWVHPRLSMVCHSPVLERVNGLIIFILGLLLALPLPIPLSNLAAAWSIFLISLGVLEDDGLLILIGYLIALLTAAFFAILTLKLRAVL